VSKASAAPAIRAFRWSRPLLVLVVPLSALVLAASFGSDIIQLVMEFMLVNLIVVIGIQLFVGNSGVLSFGHLTFMAMGAYTSALLTIPERSKRFMLPELPGWLMSAHLSTELAVLIAAAAAGVVGLLIAIPLMRLNGIAASIATFAVLIVAQVVLSNWTSVTRGTQTMIGVPLDTTMWSAFAWVVVALVVAYVFQGSRVALRLRATREDEVAARSAGIGVVRERCIAFAISAALVAIGGSLYGHLLGAFSPDAFYLTLTFTCVAMLVIGGIRSLAGAVVGVVAVTAISQLLIQLEAGVAVGATTIAAPAGFHEVGLAVAMLAILVLRPEGLTGGREFFALGSGARPVTKPGTQPDKVAGRADNEAPAVPRSKASAGDE
jgi:branched-chain amino acid transport system permease protein